MCQARKAVERAKQAAERARQAEERARKAEKKKRQETEKENIALRKRIEELERNVRALKGKICVFLCDELKNQRKDIKSSPRKLHTPFNHERVFLLLLLAR